jgi:hypothetical protein
MKKLIIIAVVTLNCLGCTVKPYLDPAKYPDSPLSKVKQICLLSCDEHISINATCNSTQIFKTSNGGYAVYSGGFRLGSYGLSK